MIRVAILGSGHVGLALAAFLGSRAEFAVRLWGRSFRRDGVLNVSAFGDGGVFAEGSAIAEPILERVVEDADVAIIAVPTHVRHSVMAPIAARLNDCSLLIAWEGTGRFPASLQTLGIDSPNVVGLQRSPILCRTHRALQSVEILGVRSEVIAATIADGITSDVQRLMAELLPFRFSFAPNYACVTLSPGNPMIHPARLYRCEYSEMNSGDTEQRFYGSWDDRASETLLALHGELASLRDTLCLPAEFVQTMADEPKPKRPSDVTREIRAAQSLGSIRLPIRFGDDGPDWDIEHRFFREDIGEGLASILEIANLAGVTMPTALAIQRWYTSLCEGGSHDERLSTMPAHQGH